MGQRLVIYKAKLTQSSYDGSSASSYNLTSQNHLTPIQSSVPGTDDVWGYIHTMAFTKWGLYPTAVGSPASATTDYSDGQYKNSNGLKMALFGGSCIDGAPCGAFACDLYGTVASSYWSFGASPQSNT